MAEEIAQEIVSLSNNLQDRVVELEGQVSMLKLRLDALESGKKPHDGWVYSAPSISEEDLEEMGFDLDAVEEMSIVLDEMKRTTNNLRWGACDQISLGGNCFSQILNYHDNFLPHWRELCDGICYLKDNDELKCFDIANVELPNHIVSMILNALRGKKLKIDSISFLNNDFGGNYGIELASWLLNHSTASRFYYEGDSFSYEYQIRPLIDAINKHKSLRGVDLNIWNGIFREEEASKAGCDVLCSIMESNKELKGVSFQSNRLKVPTDASRMIDALKGCSKLVWLDISNAPAARLDTRNEIDPNEWGLHVFREVLENNPKMTVKVGDFNANYHLSTKE